MIAKQGNASRVSCFGALRQWLCLFSNPGKQVGVAGVEDVGRFKGLGLRFSRFGVAHVLEVDRAQYQLTAAAALPPGYRIQSCIQKYRRHLQNVVILARVAGCTGTQRRTMNTEHRKLENTLRCIVSTLLGSLRCHAVEL